MKTLSWSIKILLFLTVLTPLIVAPSLHFFPYVFGKMVFYRGVIELALVLSLIYLAINFYKFQSISINFLKILKSPLSLFILAFFVLGAISTFLAPNSLHAFFGDVERGEGWFGLLHYFIFLILAVIFFEKRDWLIFFGGLGAVGLAVSVYAWIQYFGGNPQPGSFAGNPAFLSSFLIILLGGLAILGKNLTSKTWPIILAAFSVFLAATVFITGIRGALIGLVVGLLIWGLAHLFSRTVGRSVKILGGVIIAAILLAGTGFWLTKGNSFWQKVPGLNRLATASFESPSVSTRLIALGVSWEAFKEKPVFGWGPENYNIAYNKHYDPAYSYYAEDWFDRAHNKIAEVGVDFGGVGLLLYLGIFILTFYLARKNIFLVAALAAYFIQNLFLFDNVASYIPLFAVWGWLISENKVPISPIGPINPIKLIRFIRLIGLIGLIILTGYAFYAYLIVPVVQARVYVTALKTKVGEKIMEASDDFLSPYNFFQPTLRARFADMIYENNLIQSVAFRPLAMKMLAALEETAGFEKDPRQYIRLVEQYNELAKQEPAYFEKSEMFARKALALSPNRQGLLNHLAFALAGRGGFNEAIAANQKAIDLEPRAYKSYYQLGITQALAADASENIGTLRGNTLRAEAKQNIAKAWEMAKANDYQFFSEYDYRNLVTIYARWKDFRSAAEVLEEAVGCISSRTGQIKLCYPEKQNYLDLISLYRTLRDADGIVRAAEKLKAENPSLADQLDILIDLARKRNWEILDTL